MPRIKDSQADKLDLSMYGPAEAPKPLPPAEMEITRINPMMRSPLPPISISPDAVRQFDRGGKLPQRRLMTSTTVNAAGGSNAGISSAVVDVTTASTTTTIINNGAVLKVQQMSISTTMLTLNQAYLSSLPLGKVVQLVNVAANAPCRIELYGTNIAQGIDISRGLDVPPPPGTMQNLILDAVFDTFPYQMGLQDVSGANGDNPITNLIYVTVTNTVNTAGAITVTFSYVPMVT